MKEDKKVYDLEERTALFGENIIDFVKTLPINPINSELISQIVKSGTSIGANYMEVDAAESKKKISSIKLPFAKKKQKKQSIG
jgi:four helix bundle protein